MTLFRRKIMVPTFVRVDVTHYVGMKETFTGNSGFQISADSIMGMVSIFKLIFIKPAIIMG
jgi:hypothetical protein